MVLEKGHLRGQVKQSPLKMKHSKLPPCEGSVEVTSQFPYNI